MESIFGLPVRFGLGDLVKTPTGNIGWISSILFDGNLSYRVEGVGEGNWIQHQFLEPVEKAIGGDIEDGNHLHFDRTAIRKYLDSAIENWRRKRDAAPDELHSDSIQACHYIDAFQSVRTSIFGSLKGE